MAKKEPFITNRLKGVNYAFKGALQLLKTEASIQIQMAIAIIMTIAGFYFDISSIEWIVQTLAIGLIMSLEGLNTAIEKLSDFIHPEHHSKIGSIKDIAAGAVFMASVCAVIIGSVIYFPKIF